MDLPWSARALGKATLPFGSTLPPYPHQRQRGIACGRLWMEDSELLMVVSRKDDLYAESNPANRSCSVGGFPRISDQDVSLSALDFFSYRRLPSPVRLSLNHDDLAHQVSRKSAGVPLPERAPGAIGELPGTPPRDR